MKTITESKRGCGYRKPGGLYLFAGGDAAPCGKLPLPVHVCPTCGNGVKAGRGFQWVKWAFLGTGACHFKGWPGMKTTERHCDTCPLSSSHDPEEKLGLMWVGEKYYPTPEDFLREARSQGVSKRIPAVPRDFVLGKTWLALAHRKAIQHSTTELKGGEPVQVIFGQPGIFSLFIPTEIQYVVTGMESQEELDAMEKKGITPVEVVYEDAHHLTDAE